MSALQDIEKTPHIHYQPNENDEKRESFLTVVGKDRRSWEKLGVKNLAFLGTRTFAVLIGGEILIIIWWKSKHIAANGDTRPLFVPVLNFVPRLVTLSCVFIRLVATAQLGVFAAILAALILERVGVGRKELPQLSMIRCSNSGPMSLIQNVWHSIRGKAQRRYSLLVVLGIFDGFALQLMTTILVGDFSAIELATYWQKGNVSVGLAPTSSGENPLLYDSVDLWKSGSAYFPFAEQNLTARLEENGYVDAGKTYRGFFPVAYSDTLRFYEGPSTVFDARVICTAPTIQNFTFENVLNNSAPVLHGTLEWTESHPALKKSSNQSSMDVKCDMPFHTSTTLNSTVSEYWALSLCTLGTVWGEITQGLRTDFDPALADQTTTFLLINVTGDWTDYASAYSSRNVTLTQSQNSTGPWAKYEQNDKRIDTSLCFFNPTPHDFHVVIEQDSEADEQIDMDPTILTWNTETKSYDTKDVLTYLGVISNDLKRAQQVFNLSTDYLDKSWDDLQIEKYDKVSTDDFVWNAVRTPGTSSTNTWILSPFTNYSSVYRTYTAIVQDVLKQSNNPALAVQGLFTVAMQAAYLEYFDQFSVNKTVITVDTEAFFVPVQWKFLSGVLGLLGFHILLMATAVVLFMKQTEVSLLGSNWSAILQVVSLDHRVRDIPNAHAMTDKEMESVMGEGAKLRIGKPTTS